jgi:glycosyltransferase involved in cell wall biosynthesis
VFVSLSEQEAQSVVLLEAIAAQTPAVASDIPAHRSVADLAPKAVQLLPLSGSVADVARAIERAVDIVVEPSAVPDWEDVRRMTMAVYRSVVGLPAEASGGEAVNPLMAELVGDQVEKTEASSLH